MTSPDFRSQRSESPEGQGRARRAWDRYAAVSDKVIGPVLHPVLDPLIEPAVKKVARDWVGDLVGFWVLWHLYGGFEGLEDFGYSRATIYRKIKRFRRLFGKHPDEWTMEGIVVDPEAYWAAERKRQQGES